MDEVLIKKLISYQRSEINEYHIYRRVARKIDNPENRQVLENIANEELQHYNTWRKYTGKDVAADGLIVWKYCLISRILGFTFGVKLMERGEKGAQENYSELIDMIPEAKTIMFEENQHETALLEILNEEKLRYSGSIVLGLNDALVELTGALAGLTFALQDRLLIALTGSITGIAAALSMGASEYLSTKAEGDLKNPVKASIYTTAAYFMTVLFLVLPYLILENYFLSLGLTLFIAVVIIAVFNYYISVAKDEPFKERFIEMTVMSLSVAGLSFLIGFLVRKFLGVDV
jgi:VIT1/CCC1 family predicted Fe2+/Mn2+ transporter